MSLQDQRFSQEQVRILKDGEILFEEGEESREMYIVQQGAIVIDKNGHVLAELNRGDFVGEMALLESLPRSATARARGETRLLSLHPGGFLLKIRRDPTFAFEIMQQLSRRIRMTNEKLLEKLAANKSEANRQLTEIVEMCEYTPMGDKT